MGNLFFVPSGAPSTSAAPTKLATGTALKSLIQIATPSTAAFNIIEWGIAFDGSAAATPVAVELVDVAFAATVTAHSTTTVQNISDFNGLSSSMTMGTTATGYNASSEGTPSGTIRQFSWQLVAPTSQFVQQYPLGREPRVGPSRFCRLRVTAPATVNASAYILIEEV